jgi:hypothetical protein
MEWAPIPPQLMASMQQIPPENLSQRSVLPKFELSTFPAETKAKIVNTMPMRHHDILSRQAR